ncbi:hypothetical protein AAE478_007512 [Parahypoxylon ruwenzoriense]
MTAVTDIVTAICAVLALFGPTFLVTPLKVRIRLHPWFTPETTKRSGSLSARLDALEEELEEKENGYLDVIDKIANTLDTLTAAQANPHND